MFLQNLYKQGARHFAIPDTLPSGNNDDPTPVNSRFSFVNASRDIIGENFFSGVMDFHVNNPMYRWIQPADCGFKLRLSYSYKDPHTGLNRPIRMSDGIAFAQDIGSQMFQSVDWQINGQSITRITRDMPQIAAMFRRLDQTQTHIMAMGNTLNLESHLFYERQKQTAIDGGQLALSQTPVKLPLSNYVGNLVETNTVFQVTAQEVTVPDLVGLYVPYVDANANQIKENGQAIELKFQMNAPTAPTPERNGAVFSGIGYPTVGAGARAWVSQIDIGDYIEFDAFVGTTIPATQPFELNLGTQLLGGNGGNPHLVLTAGALGAPSTLTFTNLTSTVTDLFARLSASLNFINCNISLRVQADIGTAGQFQFDTNGRISAGLYPIISGGATATQILEPGGTAANFALTFSFINGINAPLSIAGSTLPAGIDITQGTFDNFLVKLTLVFNPKGGLTAAAGGLGLRATPLEIIKKTEVISDVTVAPYTETFSIVCRCNDPVLKQKLLSQLTAKPVFGMQALKRDLLKECRDVWREAEFFFKLPIQFFYMKHMLPGIPMTFQLQPFQKQQFLRGLFETTQELPIDSIEVKVENMEFMMFTVDGPDMQSKKFNLDLRTMNMHPLSTVRNDSLTSITFTVSPSTEGLAVAFQSSKVDQSSLYSKSDFKFYKNVGRDKDSYDYVKHLSRFWINYGDSTFPNTPMDPILLAGRDRLAVDWMETTMQTGLYFGHDPETYQDWKQRGMYFFYQCARPKNARNTDVTVNVQFQKQTFDPSGTLSDTDFNSLRVMVFDIVRSACQITIANGKVVGIDIQEIS